MRVSDLLSESDYMEDLGNFVLDLLVAYRSNNLTNIDFEKFLASLKRAGFVTVDHEYLTDFLDQQDIVDTVDAEQNIITLKSDSLHPERDGESEEAEAEVNTDKVSNMAGKEAKKAINK